MTSKESLLSAHNRKDEAVKIATRLSKKNNTRLVIMEGNENPGNGSK